MTDNLDSVAAHEHATWQRAADTYSQNISVFTAFSGQLDILRAVGGIGPSDAVLELGCGPGDLAKQLSEIAARVVGIDFSQNMIDIAKQQLPDLEFQVANAEAVPFEDSEFDVVVSNYTAHHFSDPTAVFREASRVLRTDGRVAVIMPIQSEQPGFAAVMNAIFDEIPPEEAPGGPLLNATEPAELARYMESAGFRDVAVEKQTKPLLLESVEAILAAGWDFMGLAERPQDMQDRIRAQTIENAEEFEQADGTYSFPDKVLVGSGHK